MKLRRKSKKYYKDPVFSGELKPRKTGFFKSIYQIVISGIIIAVLLFIVINFYVFSSIVSVDSFLLIFLMLTLLTDGIFLLIHLLRRPIKTTTKPRLDPSKVSAVIACYNGEDEIGETIDNLLRQLPKSNIFVVSDASTDRTAEVARSYGVNVIINKKNMHKAFSISIGVYRVKTPYVLILDDDVLIGDAVIPTNLMDEGYSAVAFNVLPISTDTFVNAIQRFEYRTSMHIGKNLRSSAKAIGNVSGAIGLYRTEDLKEQAYLHSGQFAGEDEQRTMLSHIYGSGKGVIFSEETVHTHVPNTFYALYRQRAYSWSLSVPELLPLYISILLSVKLHYLLKSEKAYNIYILLTDPLRILFLWTLFLRPRYLVATYLLYLTFNIAMWVKTRRKDQFLVILVYPLYSLWLSLCRFIGNIYWLKVKADYFKNKRHKLVYNRYIVAEAIFIILLIGFSWAFSTYNFSQDLKLFNKIRYSRLEEESHDFNYDSEAPKVLNTLEGFGLKYTQQAPAPGTFTSATLERGDTLRSVAHKLVDSGIKDRSDISVPYAKRYKVDKSVVSLLEVTPVYRNSVNSTIMVDSQLLENYINKGLQEVN